jgi:hypothetical protein
MTASGSIVSSLTAPSGFTLGGQVNNGSFASGVQWWWKIAGGSEPSSYSVTETAAAGTGVAAMLAWSGVDTADPIDVSATDDTAETGVTTISLTPLTTTVADTLYVALPYEYNGRTITVSAAGAMTKLTQSTTTGRTVAVLEESIPSAGAVTGRTATASASSDWRGLAFALAPSSGGGGSTQPPRSMHHFNMLRRG